MNGEHGVNVVKLVDQGLKQDPGMSRRILNMVGRHVLARERLGDKDWRTIGERQGIVMRTLVKVYI